MKLLELTLGEVRMLRWLIEYTRSSCMPCGHRGHERRRARHSDSTFELPILLPTVDGGAFETEQEIGSRPLRELEEKLVRLLPEDER